MSRFMSERLSKLAAYTPGEQPRDMAYIKLNTNESPFPPSPSVIERINSAEVERLNLYPDPTAAAFRAKLAEHYGVKPENVTVSNGSDEVLNFIFMAFCDGGVAYPDISYGFYSVFAQLYSLDALAVPLKADFTIDYRDYLNLDRTIVIANPNAPTGIALPLSEVEEIVRSNANNIVVIDEAYVDFGAESAITLTDRYDNLIVVQTYSKSRSLAGMRIGYGIANAEIISDLEKIRYSTNPYNLDRLALIAGEAALCDSGYYADNAQKIIETREKTASELKELGFVMTDSKTNFLFASHPKISGENLYTKLREQGILVRHFGGERVRDYLRITIGTAEQMDKLVSVMKNITSKI